MWQRTCCLAMSLLFFFNDTATTEIYTLSLHDALPIWWWGWWRGTGCSRRRHRSQQGRDRKSTRLNSSHSSISYAVFCLKKKSTSNYVFDVVDFEECDDRRGVVCVNVQGREAWCERYHL